MSGKFLSQREMSAARYAEEIYNSYIKRNNLQDERYFRTTRHVICGCGVEGCMFISTSSSSHKSHSFPK